MPKRRQRKNTGVNRAQKREYTILSYKREQERLLGLVREYTKELATYQFMLACILWQMDCQAEIRLGTRDKISQATDIRFIDMVDERKEFGMYIIRLEVDLPEILPENPNMVSDKE